MSCHNSTTDTTIDLNVQNLATIFTVIYTFINMFRVMYHIHITRLVELDNVIKDAVQKTYDIYVKERKYNGIWNNATKIQATEQAYQYVVAQMNLCCLGKKPRIVRQIKDEVAMRKSRRLSDIVKNRIDTA